METALVAKGDRKQAGLRLTPEFLQKLAHVAVDRRQSLNELLEAVIVDWYNAQPESAKYGQAAQYQPTKRGPKKDT